MDVNLEAWRTCFSAVVPRAAFADALLSELIVRLLAPSDAARQQLLRESVVPRMRDVDRVLLLGQLTDLVTYDDGKPEQLATLPGHLKALFVLRHQFAHAVASFDDDPDQLTLTQYKKGEELEIKLARADIEKLDVESWAYLDIMDQFVEQLGGERRVSLREIHDG